MKVNFVNTLKSGLGKLSGYLIWFLIVLLTMSLVRNVRKVGRVKSEIDKEKAKIAKIEAQNLQLEEQTRLSQSEAFIEKQVRDKLGYAREGEAVVILPDEEILKKLAPEIREEEETLPDPNWKKWISLFR